MIGGSVLCDLPGEALILTYATFTYLQNQPHRRSGDQEITPFLDSYFNRHGFTLDHGCGSAIPLDQGAERGHRGSHWKHFTAIDARVAS